MNPLPLDLLHQILFKLEPKSVAKMGCTNKYFKSRIFEDPSFQFNYSCQIGSSFILNCRGLIACDSMSPGRSTYRVLKTNCHILDSRSGLLLLFIGGQLVIINPFTKKFRLIDHSGSKRLAITKAKGKIQTVFCFLPERNQTTKRFKIIGIIEAFDTYEFEINDGGSWRLSKTTITPDSKSCILLDKSVYFDGSFHWLRCDGSIIAFNPETEQAYSIPSHFQESIIPSRYSTQLFAVDDKISRLTYILGTRETIAVYTLKNFKWSLARKIKNVTMGECLPQFREEVWKVVAYDGKQLVVQEMKFRGEFGMKVYVYDMEVNSWGVLGSCNWGPNGPYVPSGPWYYHRFTPSLVSVGNEHSFQSFKEIKKHYYVNYRKNMVTQLTPQQIAHDKNMFNLDEIIEFINKSSCVS